MNSAIQFRIEESIGVLLINRPERRNALDWAAQADFAATIKDIAGRSDLRALILTGAGEQVFVAGGDLSELVQAPT
ncbi:MAG: enoyl-CoA hydratase/isomerase family protein, partial [Anaerolineales bacterium]|nr:enoyl-CoA hydratase/isomerase family protein [Anaerolineales bacterium]